MDKGDHVFTVECPERRGTVVRDVSLVPLTPENLRFYWEKLSQFPTLFNRNVEDVDDFITTFISDSGDGNIKANGLVWQVDDVGLFWITDIYPEYQATTHFTFWDRCLWGREPLVREMARYLFETFGFRRLVAEIPVHSWKVHNFVRNVGFVNEGRLREAVEYKGKWFDVGLYSILQHEPEQWDS